MASTGDEFEGVYVRLSDMGGRFYLPPNGENTHVGTPLTPREWVRRALDTHGQTGDA